MRIYKKVPHHIARLAAIIVTLATFAACSDSPDSLSASKAKKIFAKEFERLGHNEHYNTIQTGYFECNDDETRYIYRQLAANDVITYKCEKIKKNERKRKSRQVVRGFFFTYYDTEYYYVTDTITTYFITVALTDKGRELVVDSIPSAKPSDDDKDLLVNKEIDSLNSIADYPENNVKYDEFGYPETSNVVTALNDEYSEKLESENDYTIPTKNTADTNKTSDYEEAKAKETQTQVYVKSYKTKILKARNVLINNLGVTTAQAEILTEITDVTPFGRIISFAVEKHRNVVKAKYIYYQDKGWQLSDDTEIKNFFD